MIENCGNIYVPTCDGCGAELLAEYDFYDALDAIKRAGWRTVPPENGVSGEWEHYCPECTARWMFND